MNKRQSGSHPSRREMLKRMALGVTGLACATQWGPRAWADDKSSSAQSVIQIWMWGGPSHLDTFDPKPEAGRDYCGPLAKAIGTSVDGIQINAMLPLLAQQAERYAIIRSMTHGINSHETASYMTQTGSKPDHLVYPCTGAVVSKFKGYEHGYKGLVPPYIVLTEPQGRFSESGFLGQKYKPFATGGDPNKTPFAVEGLVAPGISDEHQVSRRKLLQELDSLGQAIPGAPAFRKWNQAERGAYEMMFGAARKLFDLSEEKDELRDRYGRSTFGQSCLIARRLVEHGVPYVTINYKGWDTHKQHFEIMNRKLPELDKGLATLLGDLSDRGILNRTIVWWGGEFGRTPKVQWEAPWNGGRGHHGHCFTALLAGGGFKGGRVVGASDAKGEEVDSRPVYPRDLIGSIYKQLGIDPDRPLPNPRNLDVKVLAPKSDEQQSPGLLTEIL